MILRRPSAVSEANRVVPITMVCRAVGAQVEDDPSYQRSIKIHCPFGPIYHSDQGDQAALRLYPETNTGWCFAGCGYFTPVSLAAQAWGLDTETAAVQLLDMVGHKPVSLAQEWANVVTHETAPDSGLLAEALKVYCARIAPGWEDLQFEQEVARMLNGCLELLPRVRTEPEARQWLSTCKEVMGKVLDRAER